MTIEILRHLENDLKIDGGGVDYSSPLAFIYSQQIVMNLRRSAACAAAYFFKVLQTALSDEEKG